MPLPSASFSTVTVQHLIDALKSPEPTPGGGTASAIAGAMGVALLVMVAGLTRTRGGTDEERQTLSAVRASLEPIAPSLQACADGDTDAFNQVMAAYRRPKATDEEKAARKAAVQQALKAATDVPLETLRLATVAMELGESVARHGNAAAASDVGVAASLLRAAAEGAAANVRINLEGLADEDYKTSAGVEAEQLLVRTEDARTRLLAAL